jgi:hypothetical protein
MSFPDSEKIAKEIEKEFPFAADRLRQYEKLSKTQERLITELQLANMTAKEEKRRLENELYIIIEEKKKWIQIPSVKEKLIQEAIARRDEAISELKELQKGLS